MLELLVGGMGGRKQVLCKLSKPHVSSNTPFLLPHPLYLDRFGGPNLEMWETLKSPLLLSDLI